MHFVLCDIVMFHCTKILSIIEQEGQTPLQAAEKELHSDYHSSREIRFRIISHLRKLNRHPRK